MDKLAKHNLQYYLGRVTGYVIIGIAIGMVIYVGYLGFTELVGE